MCGRFALWSSGEHIAEAFGLDAVPEVKPSRDIVPASAVLAVARSKETPPRLLAPRMLWGFPLAGGDEAMINARSETADTKPTFRSAFANRRCVVPANGFYERETGRGTRELWFFPAVDDHVVGIAAIYAPLPTQIDGLRYGLALLTTEPNDTVAPVHHRMPVVLPLERAGDWLARDADSATLKALCTPVPSGLLEAYPVMRRPVPERTAARR